MRRFLLFLFVAIICTSGVLSAPADDDAKDDTAAAKDKSADDRAVTLSTPSVLDTLMSGGNIWNIVQGALATLLILGGLGLAFYHFYYQKYQGYNAATTAAYALPETYSGYYAGQPMATAQAYYSSGRALPGGNFSFTQVLDLIALAQETYEKFDFQSLECQKKALCELQQKQTDFGEIGRKISNNFSFMDALEGLPMPAIIQTYLREYKEAITQGKNSSKDCAAVYPKCDFSIKEVFVKYAKKAKKASH